MTRPQLETYLQQLLTKVTLSEILDTLADISTQNATDSETLDTQQAARWDQASGKLTVLSNHLRL